MGFLRRDQQLADAGVHDRFTPRFKIKVIATSGETFYWHKRGRLHTVEEDVADIFVASFKPELFQVRRDGSLTPPSPGETLPIERVEKEAAGEVD